MLATDRWQEHDLVFPSTVGTPLDNSHVTHRLQALLEQAGLPMQRFHDLHHATASLLLAEGLDLFTVKEILGYSQISLTANTYGHLMKKLSEDAAGRLDRALAADDKIVIDDIPGDRPDSTG
jgi:site-specific recombinase XerD